MGLGSSDARAMGEKVMADESVELTKWADACEEYRAKYKEREQLLETIRLTLPVPFRPETHAGISEAINKWAEDKQSFIMKLVEKNDELRAKLSRADELRESAQSVTRKLQGERDEVHLDRDGCLARLIGEMRGEIEVLREKLRKAEEL